LLGSSRIFAIDNNEYRLKLAQEQGAECINFDQEDPIEVIKDNTKGLLADVVIDAVGIDAVKPSHGPAQKISKRYEKEFNEELKKIAPNSNPSGSNWIPGNAPSQALRLAVDLVKKCGTISIIGVYPETAEAYPIGKAMNKNLRIVMGNCPHRKYIPNLLLKVAEGAIDPTKILTQITPLTNALDAYKKFDQREMGWVKVALKIK
ncbi:MAG TPA: zinc-binding dehydrogenase, partial [Flavisolibacter sp.]|jgi:threonine dehydrogenase-like Zn-dependent dehydrogenase|nr:zinc-binding dehydrogenase [Flavisolibacter sp.]